MAQRCLLCPIPGSRAVREECEAVDSKPRPQRVFRRASELANYPGSWTFPRSRRQPYCNQRSSSRRGLPLSKLPPLSTAGHISAIIWKSILPLEIYSPSARGRIFAISRQSPFPFSSAYPPLPSKYRSHAFTAAPMASESDSEDDTCDPPVRHIFVRSEAGVFSYDGYQLDFHGHRYSKNVARHLPILDPSPAGSRRESSVVTRYPRHRKPKAWWAAQCLFRGLSSEGTVADLQDNLRGHEEEPVAGNILRLLERARRIFRRKNAEARENDWVNNMSDEEKAAKDPRRYLEEAFPEGERKPYVLLSTCFVRNIQATAAELGLSCEYTHAPADGDAALHMARYWVVIGQDRGIVTDKVRTIERESQRLEREQQEGQLLLRRKKKTAKLAQQPETAEEKEVARSKGWNWDVCGLWRVSCPHIEEGWSVEDLTLRIYQQRTRTGLQMLAAFDFGLVTGVFCFERQQGAQLDSDDNDEDENVELDDVDARQHGGSGNDRSSASSSGADECDCLYHNRDDDDDDDDHHHHDDDQQHDGPTPKTFYLGATTQPSAQHPTWNYRYRQRGVDTADADLYSITFCGPRGQTLRGTFGGSVYGDCTFTGAKMAGGGTLELGIRDK
ncbi:hypothetical protein JHW43_006509 [Diplocarpon mali]|nr:hypothetical protein JHW43_006509 [Diplocarpon mali]